MSDESRATLNALVEKRADTKVESALEQIRIGYLFLPNLKSRLSVASELERIADDIYASVESGREFGVNEVKNGANAVFDGSVARRVRRSAEVTGPELCQKIGSSHNYVYDRETKGAPKHMTEKGKMFWRTYLLWLAERGYDPYGLQEGEE